MPKAALQSLKAELGEGASELLAFETVTDEQLQTFVIILQESKKRQRATLNKGMEDALSHVPMLLRGAVRKIMFG